MTRFLLAHLQMEFLGKKDNIRDIRKGLNALPQSLSSFYEKAMERIRGQDGGAAERAADVLSWLTFALGPLSLDALQHALAVGSDDEELDKEALPDKETIASVCAGLVRVKRESETIDLVHHTAREYLQKLSMPPFLNAHAAISKACLRYLSFGAFKGGPSPSDGAMKRRLQEYPFLGYAARHWGNHAKLCSDLGDVTLHHLTLSFLQQKTRILCSVQAMHLPAYEYPGYSQDFPQGFTSLHLAAFFGLAQAVRAATAAHETGGDLDVQDSNGRSPLSLAAERGHMETAVLLLEKGASVATKDARGWTALHWACNKGYESMARHLLSQHEADPSVRDRQGATALYWAAEKGHESIVRLLLDNGAQVNMQEARGTTPLQGASANGHEAVVRLLLDKGAAIDAKDAHFGRTALHRASVGGHLRVVELLLTRGANINAANNWNRPPIRCSAGTGREAVVKLLLEHRADTTLEDTVQGATVLHAAAGGGYSDAVRFLIDAGADKNVRSGYLRETPLHWAARNGHATTVQTLKAYGAEAAARDRFGMTALHKAAANGQDAATSVLLNWTDVDSKDDEGAMPLHWAAAGGHKATVQVLLKNGAGVQARDKHGRTPLHYAAEAKNTSGINALHNAAKECELAEIQTLLADGVDINSKDSAGATALHWAATWGCAPAVRLLLENGADPTVVDESGFTAFHRAANDRHGRDGWHEAAVWLLLEASGTAADQVVAEGSSDGATARRGHGQLTTENGVKALSPLPNAATAGHIEVAQLLLLSHGADSQATSYSGKTAWDEAAQSGHVAMTSLLSQQPAHQALGQRAPPSMVPSQELGLLCGGKVAPEPQAPRRSRFRFCRSFLCFPFSE